MSKTGGSDAESAIDALIEPWNRSDAPGLVIGVAREGRFRYRRALGLASIESGLANSLTTRMRIGSLSKHFTSLAVLMLAEDGRLDIDGAVRDHIPELPARPEEPTLRQLMAHSGGYRCYLDLSLLTNGLAVLPEDAPLDYLARQTSANFRAGERMIYCNSGYHLLTLVVERVSGMSFEAFLADRIFAPLGMTDTALLRSDMDLMPGVASLHVANERGFRRGLFPAPILGEGGLVSTVDDMLRWLGHLRRPDRVGSSSIWRDLLEHSRFSNGTRGQYCLGLTRSTFRGVEVIQHPGGVIGGSAHMLSVPDHGLDLIIMTNRSDINPIELGEKILELLLEGALEPAPAALSAANHGVLIGRYHSQGTGQIYEFADQAGKLTMTMSGSNVLPLVADESGHLVTPRSDAWKVIVPEHKADEPLSLIDIVECGYAESYQRLPAPDTAIAAALIGSYYGVDADAAAEILRAGTELFLEIHGRYGRSRFKLEPLGGVLFGYAPADSGTMAAGVLSADEEAGTVSGFCLNSYALRGLPFVRR